MTGKDILDSALDLLGLRDAEGDIPSTVFDLKQRSFGLINILMAKYAPLNSRVTGEEFCIKQLGTVYDTVEMHDMITMCILPFSLAALLIQDEDASLASSLEHSAREAYALLEALPKTTRKDISEAKR